MKVAVLGAGAIGAYVGAALHHASADVHLIARGPHLAAIRQHGVRVLSPRGGFTARAHTTLDPAEISPVDFVFLGLKARSYAACGPLVEPLSLDDYRAHGGCTALRRAFVLGPAEVIREVTDSGLVGRGGAAFPTGRKWQATASRPDHPHSLVCNADESEPGTFKDRVVVEGDPYPCTCRTMRS